MKCFSNENANGSSNGTYSSVLKKWNPIFHAFHISIELKDFSHFNHEIA